MLSALHAPEMHHLQVVVLNPALGPRYRKAGSVRDLGSFEAGPQI